MGPAELAAAAAECGRLCVITGALQREFGVPLILARLLARKHPVQEYTSFTEEERAETCAAVWAEAYAASRQRLKVLIDKGVADAFAANPAAQQRLADGLRGRPVELDAPGDHRRATIKTSGTASPGAQGMKRKRKLHSSSRRTAR